MIPLQLQLLTLCTPDLIPIAGQNSPPVVTFMVTFVLMMGGGPPLP